MKRALVIIGALLLLTTSVYAQSFTTAYKDGDNFVEKSTFQLEEQPWLHINVPDTDFTGYLNFSYWNYPAPGSSYFLATFFTPAQEERDGNNLYFTFPEATWEAIRKTGDWGISAATVLIKPGTSPFFGNNLQSYSGNTTFKVVPEPISTSLFVIGGIVLAAGTLRKKKNG